MEKMIIGIGVDIVRIKRIKKIYDVYGERFLKKILGIQEIQYMKNITNKKQRIEKIATRFAAKEAIIKAIPTKTNYSYYQFQIKNLVSGKPMIMLDDSLKSSFSNLKINNFHISLSHEKDYAVAFVTLTS